MIKIIESGAGVRFLYDGIEVFNHTEVVPFIKSLRAEVSPLVRRGRLSARFVIDGEFAMNNYRVLTGGMNSGNIKFWGYDNKEIKIHAVESDGAITFNFTADSDFPVRLTVLGNAFESIYIDGVDYKGKTATNILPVKIPFAARLTNKLSSYLHYSDNFSVLNSRGFRTDIKSDGLLYCDFTKKMITSYYFEHCPASVTVSKDDSKKNYEIDKLYASLNRKIR